MNERWTGKAAAAWLRRPGQQDHKYTRGVLGARIGTRRYPGAAVLGVSAAWRTGLGMVRYVACAEASAIDGDSLPSPQSAVLAARPETVFGAGRCDAWLIGSGTDAAQRSGTERAWLLELLSGTTPVVVDAGALDLVSQLEDHHAPLILTPHARELGRLREATGVAPAQPLAELAAHLGATILAKGSETTCATPGGRTISCGPATPWLATAGTGDVLGGILGALVAAHAEAVRDDPELLAALGASAAVVHDRAARHAAQDPNATGDGHPITALDVADAIPHAFVSLANQ